jgi:hypothetical protein
VGGQVVETPLPVRFLGEHYAQRSDPKRNGPGR